MPPVKKVVFDVAGVGAVTFRRTPDGALPD